MIFQENGILFDEDDIRKLLYLIEELNNFHGDYFCWELLDKIKE